jgi:hypothetical protein
MKEKDDTPLPESKSDDDLWLLISDLSARVYLVEKNRLRVERHSRSLAEHVNQLELRIAELETRRVANEYNQEDPEWH